MTPKARPFCDRQVGELREYAHRRRNTWFPAPRNPSSLTSGPQPSAAPTGWRSLGTQERMKWAFPAAAATPESATGNPSPSPPMRRPPPRAARVSPAPAALPVRSQPQWRPPGAQLGPTPTQSHLNLDPRSPGLPSPWCAPGAFSASVSTSESTTGKPAPNPARSRLPPHAARVRPAPARSRYLPSF